MADTPKPASTRQTFASRSQELAPSLLALLAIVGLGGMAALPVSVWPLEISNLQWRTRSAQLYLTTVPPLVFLIAVMLIAAVHSGRHRAVRVMAVIYLVLAATTLLLLPFYLLDFMSSRHVQPQEVLGTYTRDGIRLALTGILLVPFLIWAGRRAWSAGRPDSGMARGEGHGLVVGQ